MTAGHPMGGTGAIVTGFTACALRVFFGNGITRMIPLAPAGIPIGIPARCFVPGWIPIVIHPGTDGQLREKTS